MLCPNCQVEFNSTTNIPRILIFCGHTFCHNCIEQLLSYADDNPASKQQLECPECSTLNIAADGINSFPKNLVLLQVQAQSQINTQNNSSNNSQLQPSQSKKEAQNSDKNRQESVFRQQQQQQQNQQQEPPKAQCNLHNKKLEAFCEKDLQVLCIDCILSDQHKSHEIISVQKAAEKQRQQLYDEVTSAQKTEEKLKFIQNDIKRHVGEMHQQAEKNRKELSSIYSYVRELLLEREQTLKRQISENLTREEQESEQKSSEISDFISNINLLKAELLQQNQESEIEILQKAKQRTLISGEVNGTKSREIIAFNLVNLSQACQSLNEIKRDQELTQISKILNPTYKGPAIGQTLGQAQSNLYQHTMSTANKIKKAGTQVQSTISNNLNGLMPQPQFNPVLITQGSDKQKDEIKRTCQKSNPSNNPTRSKVSPNRIPMKQQTQVYQQNKKQGVTVLDQNKQKPQPQQQQQFNKPVPKNQGSFNNHLTNPNQINLYNYNQYNQQYLMNQNMGNQADDMCQDGLTNLGGDDVSSIYPLETNDMYYQYQDNPNTQRTGQKRDESVGALENILESLNKSANHEINSNEVEKQGNSTASETGGSQQDLITPPVQDNKVKAIKSQVESPKQRKNNPWKAQNNNINKQNKSGKKCMKKDNSTTDLEDFKLNKNRLINVNQCNTDGSSLYRGQEEKKGNKRNSSLHRYSSNNNANVNSESPSGQKGNLAYMNQYEDQEVQKLNLVACSVENFQYGNSNNNAHQLQSLSQERAKRKQQKMNEVFSNEQSPFKGEASSSKEFDKNQFIDMLNQCTKNIDSMNIKPISRRQNLQQSNSHQDSPVKLQSINSSKAAVCQVDLTKKDEEEQQLMRVLSPDERDLIRENEEQEGNLSKNIPNATNQKDLSPFKHAKNIHHSNSEQSYNSSPNRQQVMKSTESLDNLMTKVIKNQDNSLELKNQPFNLVGGESYLQQSVSVDTSVSDPFRALCRVKEEFIFVFSGFDDQKLVTCEALDIQRGTWKQIAQISKARTKFSAVPISKSRILIFGGKQADGSRTGDIEEYNLKTNKFKILPFKLPKAKSGFSSCVKREEGKIFFCGGNSGSVLKKFDCLDLKKGKWSRWPEMIQKRDELAVALGPDGKIYAIGGYGGGTPNYSGNQQDDNQQDKNGSSGKSQSSNCLRTAERFDFNTGQWEMLPEMNEARRALAAVALPDGIYAIGGYDGKQYLSSVEKFDLQKQQWIPVKSMNTSRCTLSAVVSSDCQFIYALGGFNGFSLDLVERYNTMTDEWEFVTPMITKRFMHEAVCLVTH